MSRVGVRVIPIPEGVVVSIAEGEIHVKGPNGEISTNLPVEIKCEQEDDVLRFTRPDDTKESKARHGLARALTNNMVIGVTQGFTKALAIEGVGYRAEVSGNKVVLNVGFSHPVEVEIPKGLSVSAEGNTKLAIKGVNKELVGQFAADLRSFRPPEPYKGKGIRYEGEYVRRKVGKTGAV